MSPSKTCLAESIKFTRGEKCLFTHLIITFVMILLMIIVYFVHLCWVNHTGKDIFMISRRSSNIKGLSTPEEDFQSVGLLYLNVTPTKIVCNTLLLRQRWSLTPAHCVAMRSDPDFADFLPTWRIKYKLNYNYIGLPMFYTETGIKQSLIHYQFNRDEFKNNIGLLKHIDLIPGPKYIIPINIEAQSTVGEVSKGAMVGWTWSSHSGGGFLNTNFNYVHPVVLRKCHELVSPIVQKLRDYEYCVQFYKKGEPYANHGALYVINFKITGFFSWGDKRSKGFPLIILNIVHFKDWFENIIDL